MRKLLLSSILSLVLSIIVLLLPKTTTAVTCLGTYDDSESGCTTGNTQACNGLSDGDACTRSDGTGATCGGGCCGKLDCGVYIVRGLHCINLADGSCGPQSSVCGTLRNGCDNVTPSPGVSPSPGSGGGGGNSCSGSCFPGIANCGAVGRPGGSGSCPAGQLCCDPPNAPATGSVSITVNGVYVPTGGTIILTQGTPASVRAFPSTRSGVVSECDFGTVTAAAAKSLAFSPTSANWVCVHTINWPPVCDRYRDPPGGWTTTAYPFLPTSGILANAVNVTCWVVDHGTIPQGGKNYYNLQVLPMTTPPPPSSGIGWWQVVNGDVVSNGDLVSKVPTSGGGITTYNDNDPAVIYTPPNRAIYVGPVQAPMFLFDYHYLGANGAIASLNFNGSSVTYIYFTGGGGVGTAIVSIDGIQVDAINERTATYQYQQAKTYTVTPGIHTITVKAKTTPYTGIVYLDAFKVNPSPTGQMFAMPPSLLSGYPGVAVYNGNYDFTSDPNSQGSPSDQGWLAKTAWTGKIPGYAYFKSLLASDTVINTLPSGSVPGTTFASGGSVSPDGYFYYKYTGNLTITSDATLNATRKVVLLVEGGNLTINGNITISNPGQGFFMALVNGNTSVGPTILTLHGIYLSDGNFSTGTGSVQLNVKGSVAALGGVSLQRDLGAANATTPAEVFTYDPALLFVIPRSLGFSRLVWKEIAP